MGLGQNSGNWYGEPYGVQNQLMSTGWMTNPYDPYGTNILPTFSYEPIGAHTSAAPTNARPGGSPFPTYTATTPTVNTTPAKEQPYPIDDPGFQPAPTVQPAPVVEPDPDKAISNNTGSSIISGMSTNPYLGGATNQYGFPVTTRDTYSNPISWNGQVMLPPGMSGSTTSDYEWQSALDTVFGPRKTGWNAATNW